MDPLKKQNIFQILSPNFDSQTVKLCHMCANTCEHVFTFRDDNEMYCRTILPLFPFNTYVGPPLGPVAGSRTNALLCGYSHTCLFAR